MTKHRIALNVVGYDEPVDGKVYLIHYYEGDGVLWAVARWD